MSDKTEKFIETIGVLAQNEYMSREKWILPSVCIAQAALESGWNLEAKTLFGIKGAGYTATTSEYYNGVCVQIEASFRAYPNVASAVVGYYDFLRDTPRYVKALNNANYKEAVDKLIHTTDGYPYATDPNYISKICNIIEKYNLTDWDTRTAGTSTNRNDVSKPDIIYAIKTVANGWLPEVKNTEDYAGLENKAAIGVMIKLTDKTPLKYRVHTTAGKWLGWVSGYNKNDYYNGYAGDDKTPIDAVEIKCDRYTIKYKVSSVQSGDAYYPVVRDNTVSGSESYAGVFGKPVDKFMAWLE